MPWFVVCHLVIVWLPFLDVMIFLMRRDSI